MVVDEGEDLKGINMRGQAHVLDVMGRVDFDLIKD